MIRNKALEFASMEILQQRRKRCCALGGSRERLRAPRRSKSFTLARSTKKGKLLRANGGCLG